MEINPGQEQEYRPMNNEETQLGIAMETASPLNQRDRKRGYVLLLNWCTICLRTQMHTLFPLITKPAA